MSANEVTIPTSVWTRIAPTVEVWHNHGHTMPLDRIGEGPGIVRIRLYDADPQVIPTAGWCEWRAGPPECAEAKPDP